MEEKCPCQTNVQSCCACVSMHCDECHKPKQSKFVQGRFCSNCGRPLKAELTRAYVPKSEVEVLEKEIARKIFEDINRAIENRIETNYKELENIPNIGRRYFENKILEKIVELKTLKFKISEIIKKYTGEKGEEKDNERA